MAFLGPWSKLRWKLSQPAIRRRLQLLGATVGEDSSYFGRPIVEVAPHSTLRIGRSVCLISSSQRTALGVAHPVVLRTLTDAAVLEIGDDTGVSGASICAASSVRIGRRCLIGADCMIFDTDFHPVWPPQRRYLGVPVPAESDEVFIGDDVFIGARCVVLKGTRIGDGSVISAGSIVRGDFPAYSIIAGNPAVAVSRVRDRS